jgi:hypothetical protein
LYLAPPDVDNHLRHIVGVEHVSLTTPMHVGTEQDRRSHRAPLVRTVISSGHDPHERNEDMKTMTCRQLGGPCDHAFHGATANDVIKSQDKHLREMVAGGDATHDSALTAMKGRWKHPLSGMSWYRTAKRDFAALPEE